MIDQSTGSTQTILRNQLSSNDIQSTPVTITTVDLIFAGFLLLSSLYAFGIFGWDKHRAKRPGKSRISENHLLTVSILGGCPGSLAGMLFFRHKTAKTSFKLKFAVAAVIWAALLVSYWRYRAIFAEVLFRTTGPF